MSPGIFRRNTPKVLVVIADGSEEIESVVTIDVLRRAELDVTVAGLTDELREIKCSRGVILKPDATLIDVQKRAFDAIVMPGGLGGVEIFLKNALLKSLLKSAVEDGTIIAAICAAPLALHKFGIMAGKTITSHPSIRKDLDSSFNYKDDSDVVCDGNLITSRGPGTSFQFALAIVEKLLSKDKADELKAPMCLK
ncbi:hypothetical protein ACOME3_008529 [Neoechinorhynchus agilis]